MKLYTAKLDDWEINILDISDTVNMALAKHEFMNTDGAYIQHMGNRPREIAFRTYWYGLGSPTDNSKASYGNHYYFLNAMSDSNISHTLVHPKYGVIEGFVESLSMIHDDTQDYVVIDIKFVQKDIQTLGLISSSTILDMNTQEALALNNALKNASSMMASNGFSSLLGKTIDVTQSISSQVNNVSQDIRSFCNELDTNIDNFDSFLNDVTAPLNSINASVAFVADIPSKFIGSITRACDRLVTSLAAISNLPVQFINNMTLGLDNLYSTMSFAPGSSNDVFFQTSFRNVSCAKVLGMGSSLLQTDEDSRSKELAKENKPSFDINGYRINQSVFNPFMSTNDLQSMLILIRKFAQKTMVMDRLNVDAKNMSASILQFVNDIKLKRMTVKTITVTDIPIHELMLQIGLPYQAADRILALNPGVKNPNFLTGAIKVYTS